MPTEELSPDEVKALLAKPPRRKYRNEPCVVAGLRFDSKKEARRYQELQLLVRAGRITGLNLHPRWKLTVNGVLVGVYTADSSYRENGRLVVEDVKSKASKTTSYRLRKKLMKALHGIDIVEV